MSSLITKARKGDKDAMLRLFSSTKDRIFLLCFLLCDNGAEGCAVALRAYKSIWGEIVSGHIDSEESLQAELFSRAVSYCKASILRKNSKAFSVSPNKNFANTQYSAGKLIKENDLSLFIVRNLPAMHRFVYVLLYVFQYEPEKLCRLLKLNTETLNRILNAEDANIKALLSLKAKETGEEYALSPVNLHRRLSELNTCEMIPQEAEDAAESAIDNICTPILSVKQKRARRNAWRLAKTFLCVLFIVAGIWALSLSQVFDSDSEPEDPSSDEDSSAAEYTSEYTATHYADITIEGYGTITVALDGNKAPETVQNFVDLANDEFYNGLTLHRVVEGYFMQGGDPNKDGTGGSAMQIVGEFTSNGSSNNLSHTRGAISMARTSDSYDSATSQFFIMQEDCSSAFDGEYAVFGYVTEGMDIVDAICSETETLDDGETVAEENQPVITSITIREAEEEHGDGGETSEDDGENSDDTSSDAVS